MTICQTERHIANHADDNTLYTSSNGVQGLIKSSEEASEKLFKWLDDNLMKSNADKCHLLCSTNDKVSFDYDLPEICKRDSKKLYGLDRVPPYIILSKGKILMDDFFNWQFS